MVVWFSVSIAFGVTQDRNQERNENRDTQAQLATQAPHTDEGVDLVVCDPSSTFYSYYSLLSLVLPGWTTKLF